MTGTDTSIDTIYALATPPGRSGVAVIRVSGARAAESLQVFLAAAPLPPPRLAHLCKLYAPDGAMIDHALVLYFKAPHSYTGENVVEYQLHGSPAVITEFLALLSRQPGHRMAERGEFTRRAFENCKMDLTEAEAVADLIDAETDAQKDQALAQLGGALKDLYEGWATNLTRSLAYLEADLDFPDEDLPDGVAAQVRPKLEALIALIDAHLSDNRRGERLRDGIRIAVIGAPNAGKSSLVNALAQRDIAIVSDLAGTTRDVLEVHLNIAGFPVILSDTAGLKPELIHQAAHTGHDKIESEGIRRALRAARSADLKLLMFDASTEPDAATLELADAQSLIVLNKLDLSPRHSSLHGDEVIKISLINNEGLDTFLTALTVRLNALLGTKRETPSLTRARHREALEACKTALERALSARLPELVAEDVRLAVRALGKITGRVDVEDLLDLIFSEFCIGK